MLHQVGVGALGPVFRTYEPTRDRLVAVKVFRLDVTPEQAQALADELSTAADAGLFHPSIVEPIAAGVEGTVAYRAEEYVAAETLDVALRHYAPAPIDKVLPIITQLAGAIDFARTASVGHGALHPRDIFVTPEEARATGFGVVEALERVGLRAPVRRPYSAPERVSGGSWSTPADVFSLAAIAYELLTGRRPAGTGAQIGTVSGTSAGHHPGALHAVFVRAMDEDPARRYQTALGFASALDAAARGEAPMTTYEEMSTYEKGAASVAPVAAAPVVASLRRPDSILLNEVADEDALDEDEDEPDDVAVDDAVRADSDVEIASERSLFDEEARLEDFPLDASEAAETQRFADEFSAAAADLKGSSAAFAEPAHDRDPIDPFDENVENVEGVEDIEPRHHEAPSHHRSGSTLFGHADVDDTPSRAYESTLRHEAVEHERPRAAVLPMVLAVVFGLLLGAAGVYAYFMTRPSQPPGAIFTEGKVGEQSGKESTAAPPPVAVNPATPDSSTPSSTTAAPPPAAKAGPKEAAAAPAKSGRLVVSSTPRGASVTVNGRWRGRTPFTMEDVPFGNVEVRVAQSGYSTQTERVTVSSGTPSRTLSFKLQRSAAAAKPAPSRSAPRSAAPPQTSKPQSFTGSVYVDSRPRGARVLLNGKVIGTTPMRLSDIAVGSHIIKLQLEDHSDWTTSTRVVSGQETRVSGSLERIR